MKESDTPVLIGTRWSSYTRTISMALIYLNVPFRFEYAFPYSDSAFSHNPFGRIPSFQHQDNIIFETIAIMEYINSTFSSDLTPRCLETRIRMYQYISALNDYVFRDVVKNVCKRRLDSEAAGKSEEDIVRSLERPMKKAKHVISDLEKMVPLDGTSYLCGEQVTWADYFIYPAMAAVYESPEASIFKRLSPKLWCWFKEFSKRKESVETWEGTRISKRIGNSRL